MSKYTTEVRYICENLAGYTESQPLTNVDEIIRKSAPKIFDFNFPIFDENYRLPLESKILRHFYTREICAETVGLWKLWLGNKLNEIMPYYNQLYKSELLEFNPLYDTDLTTSKEGSVDETRNTKTDKETAETSKIDTKTTDKAKTNQNSDSWDKYSDTPQGGINGLANDRYLTNATHDTSEVETNYDDTKNENRNGTVNVTGNEKTDSKINSTEEYVIHVIGKNGSESYSERLKKFRETFLNIDMMIINELADLFFNLW